MAPAALNVPGAQGCLSVPPGHAYPAGQEIHPATEVVPATLYFPGGHVLQFSTVPPPVVVLYEPAGHS